MTNGDPVDLKTRQDTPTRQASLQSVQSHPSISVTAARGCTETAGVLPVYPPLPPLRYESSAPGVGGIDDPDKEARVDVHGMMRTPSPTPSEAQVLDGKTRMFKDWRRWANPRRYTNPRGIWTLTVVIGALAFIITFLAMQHRIVNAMRPFADWMHDTPGGWLIPIAIMFVISFPPLFGHEIIAVLCGDVWGVWIGFGIVAAGTVLGELGNFYAFRWWCSGRGKKLEEKRLTYALYAQVAREGGVAVATIMRLTFIPGHLFSTCGMGVGTFLTAAVLSLPKQLATVYLGVSQNSGVNRAQTGGIKAVVILATIAMTYIAMRFINKKVDEVKMNVVYARRKARQAKMLSESDLEALPAADDTFEPAALTLPRAPPDPYHKSHVGASSPAAGMGASPIQMPKPQRAAGCTSAPADTHRRLVSGLLDTRVSGEVEVIELVGAGGAKMKVAKMGDGRRG
ncbi:hypothetical protein C8Q79DRAFT_1007215 [Trametes meyenii]|nr:hypothetical protein C8Q79DRAFT_1007215 [Trametes meyenii]